MTIPKKNTNNVKNNSLTILEGKYNFISGDNNNINNNAKILPNKENTMMETVKKGIEKFIIKPNINQIKYDLFKDINKRYGKELNVKKSIDIWEIFYYYIENIIDLINSEEKILYYK